MLALWGNHHLFNERVVNASLTHGLQMFHGDIGHFVAFDEGHFHKAAGGGRGIGVFKVAHGGHLFL